MFLKASGKEDQADCFDELRGQEQVMEMYGFFEAKYFPRLITASMQFPLNQSVGELMVSTIYTPQNLQANKTVNYTCEKS